MKQSSPTRRLGRSRTGLCAVLLMCLGMASAHAGIVLGGTRVVYDGGKRDAALSITNPDTDPYAVQVWINDEKDDTTTPVPFVANPPLFRLDPGKEQIVRIIVTPNDLPADRESVFYFNAQEIPVATDKPNMLKIALRTRIKLFYRPAAVKGNPMDALSSLTWEIRREAGNSVLVVRNPSAFHISFIGIRIAGEEIRDPTMVAPMSEQAYSLTQAHSAGAEVMFSAINDHGGYTDPVTVKVQPAR